MLIGHIIDYTHTHIFLSLPYCLMKLLFVHKYYIFYSFLLYTCFEFLRYYIKVSTLIDFVIYFFYAIPIKYKPLCQFYGKKGMITESRMIRKGKIVHEYYARSMSGIFIYYKRDNKNCKI